MRDYINDLVEIGLGGIIDMSMNRFVLEDELHRMYMKEFDKMEEQLNNMEITEVQQEVIAECIELLQTANIRACNLTYLLGVKNTFAMLEENGMLKEIVENDHA